MNPEHYHSMTDAQLQEWHELTQRVESLQEQLLLEQQRTSAILAELDTARAHHQRERADWRADFDERAAEVRSCADQLIRARNELTALTEHLPPILADWLAPFEAFSDAGLSPEFVERRQRVRHLLGLLGLYSI